MGYWGYQSPCNFVMWILTILCLVSGIIWWPIGLAGWMGCKYCRDNFSPSLGPKPGEDLADGCLAGAAAYYVYNPEKLQLLAIKPDTDLRSDFYDGCLASGTFAAFLAGIIVFAFGLGFLLYFPLCARRPAHLEGNKVANGGV